MKGELIAGAIGFVSGVVVTGLVGYFGVYKKYIPLSQLEVEVGRLEDERREKLRKLDLMDKEYEHRSSEYQEKLDEYDKRLDAYDADIESAKMELKELNSQYPAERQDVINDAFGDRWNGPLNEEEQQMINECDDDPMLEESVFTEIKERRFDLSTDPDHMIYYISMQEHGNRPDFIDEHTLTYYQGDDVLADGRNIVQTVGDLVDPSFFRYFKPNENTICFRNDNIKTDFVIERSMGTYQNAIFGIGDENAYIPEHKINQEIAKEQA